MTDRLTARQALDHAAGWLESAENKLTATAGNMTGPEQAIAIIRLSQAYATFAQAAAVVDGTIDVRARVESGI